MSTKKTTMSSQSIRSFKKYYPEYLIVFFLSLIYSVLIVKLDKIYDSFTTIGFVVCLLGILLWNVKKISVDRQRTAHLCFLTLALHGGVLLGHNIAGGSPLDLWVPDSISMHVPKSINISNFLYGTEDLSFHRSSFNQYYPTNIVVGLFFFIFGVSPLVSGVALVLIKLLTLILITQIGRFIFDKRVAFIATLTYTLMPTILFYTLTYYKEASIQALVAALVLAIAKLHHGLQLKYFALFMVAIVLLYLERFYLPPLFLASFAFGFLFLTPQRSKKFKWILGSVGTLLSLVIGFLLLRAFGTNPLQALSKIQTQFMSYSDVNPAYNAALPYPLKVIKLLFTPFFTFGKFEIFENYSYLLIWGSFLNQFTIFAAMYFIFKNFKKTITTYSYMLLPFFLFILSYSYFAPYNGRIRDSFYPIIVLFFAEALSQYSKLDEVPE